MQKIARFLVRFHTAIFFTFVALAVVGGVMALHVRVNTDMTEYLPANFEVRHGMDVMDDEFGESCMVNLMATVPQADRKDFAAQLQEFDHIATVQYDEDDSYYNKGENALFSCSVDAGSYSDDALKAINEMRGACSSRGYACWVDSQALDSATNSLGPVLVFAVIIAMIILFILASSWLEPVLLLATVLVAVLINLGTNLWLGSISDMSATCGAILQMALSMDYLIMLLNRYRQERAGGAVEAKLAMERAIAGGMTAIASSSVTTVVGLLCLIPMSFTIGADMGMVLAKGVALSLVCAFAILPSLVLWLEYYMDLLAKPAFHPNMKAFGTFSFKGRYVLAIAFVVLFAVGWGGKTLAQTSFISQSKNPDHAVVVEAFAPRNQVVVLYGADQQDKAQRIEDKLAAIDNVGSTSSYLSTVGKQYTAAEIADELDMDAPMVRMVFYKKFGETASDTLNGSALESYVRHGLGADMGDLMGDDAKDKLGSLADLIEGDLSAGRSYTAAQAANALSSHASIHDGMVSLIYLAYFANHGGCNPTWTMSTEGLLDFVVDDLMNDPAFDDSFDDATRKDLTQARETVADAKANFIGTEHNRIILGAECADDSAEMSALVADVRSLLDQELGAGSYYLVGQGPMVQEMAASFPSEMNFISLITIVGILLIVLVTFRNPAIPVLLVALIQTAFCWDLLLDGLFGSPIYYIAIITVQSILMGATIDYAILYTTSYREARQRMGVRDAVLRAYQDSIHTVMMSGSILVFVCLVLGMTAGGITGQVCLFISSGAACSVFMVLLVLPGAIAALDRFVRPRNAAANAPALKSEA